jgi:hypothetical protein
MSLTIQVCVSRSGCHHGIQILLLLGELHGHIRINNPSFYCLLPRLLLLRGFSLDYLSLVIHCVGNRVVLHRSLFHA